MNLNFYEGVYCGQHGILIFSCLLFVLFEKTNTDIFVIMLHYGRFGDLLPKNTLHSKIAEIGMENENFSFSIGLDNKKL